jgi:hypothetical protein
MSQENVNDLYSIIQKAGATNEDDKKKIQSLLDLIMNSTTITEKDKIKIGGDVKNMDILKQPIVKKFTDALVGGLANEFSKFEEKVDKSIQEKKKKSTPKIEEITDKEFKDELVKTSKSVTSVGEVENIEQYIGKSKEEMKVIIADLFPFNDEMKKVERDKVTRKRKCFRAKLKRLSDDANKGVEGEKTKKLKVEKEVGEIQEVEATPDEMITEDYEVLVKNALEIDTDKKFSEKTLRSMTKIELASIIDMIEDRTERLAKDAEDEISEWVFNFADGAELVSDKLGMKKINLKGYGEEMRLKADRIHLIVKDMIKDHPSIAKFFPSWVRLLNVILGTGSKVIAKNYVKTITTFEPPIIEKKNITMNTGTTTITGQ